MASCPDMRVRKNIAILLAKGNIDNDDGVDDDDDDCGGYNDLVDDDQLTIPHRIIIDDID